VFGNKSHLIFLFPPNLARDKRDKLGQLNGRGKGKGLVRVVMQGVGELGPPASPNVGVFNEGDMVHVFEDLRVFNY
jgi:hypothetical protein